MDKNNTEEDTPEAGKIKRGIKVPKRITEKYLYNSGLSYLQKFTSSVPNFRRVMMRKISKSCQYHTDQDLSLCQKLLDQTTETFLRQGYLNDDAYINGMIYSSRSRGLSAQKINAKLQQKGFSSEFIEEKLRLFKGNETAEHSEFIAALKTARKKKIGCFDTRNQDRQKQYAVFARAGFSFDTAKKIMALTLEEAEQILHRNV